MIDDSDASALAERFEADPGDTSAFQALEEYYFQRGEWHELVLLYERRLEAPEVAEDAQRNATLLLRLGQVLEERCLETDRAIECYQDLARSQPDYRPPLIQLRRIYVAREQWELALQVADLEKALEMTTWERAVFCAEMGDIWHRNLGDAGQARGHFEAALESDPEHVGALLGLAAVLEELDEDDGARECLERAVERLGGPDRAPALVALARLVRKSDATRAEELYRRALTDDPRSEEALEALVESAMAREQWEMVAELQERRFNLAAGAMRRLALAHESGRLWLERLRNPQGARLWLRRAVDLFPEDPVTQFLLADTERLAGNQEALAEHLARGCELAGESSPPDALRECARLAKERGDLQGAVAPLQRLLERFPERRELASELADVLERLGRDGELIETLERQVALAQSDPRAHSAALAQLGAAQEERAGDVEAAIQSYERAAGIDPAAEEPCRALERLYRKAEDWTKLRRHLDGARARASGARAVELHCGFAELILDQFSEPEAAREAFESARALEPECERARLGLERIAMLTGDEDSILEAYEREASVTTERGRLEFLVWELVRMREERAEREEALLWLDRLVGADPENRKALEHLARLHERLGHTDEQVEILERLDGLLDGRAQAGNRRRIAGLRRTLGETDRAIDAYRRALDGDPENAEALAGLAALYETEGRWAELVEVERQRVEGLAEIERGPALSRLAGLLLERLDDAPGALRLLGELADAELASPEDSALLERLLDEGERYEELEERLAARRRGASREDAEAIDRRRAALLLDRLGRASEAATLLASLVDANQGDLALRHDLERALRESNDVEALAGLLALRIDEAGDADEAARLRFERAALLEASPEHEADARAVYAELAAGSGEHATEADERLDALLERSGDWRALRERLQARLDDEPDPIAAHERLAAICRDRLGDREGAIHHLEAAARREPERAELWHSLARLYAEEQRRDDQLRAIEAELDTRPDATRERDLHAAAAALCRDHLDDPSGAERHFARLHDLDPDDGVAAEFLVRRYEDDGRSEALALLLQRRLERLAEAPGGAGEAETALRLRLGALLAGPLDDPEGAIAVLEPAAAREASLPVTAEPLADLYQRSGRQEDYVALCRKAVATCSDAGERAGWSLRLADALREAGELAPAAEAYRQTLGDRPDTREARAALRELYRRLGESDALARLLEDELSRVAGADEVPLRLELAELMVQALSRPGDALAHLRRVLELEPANSGAAERALALAEQLGRHDERLELLDGLLSRERTGHGRAARLAQRGALLAGPLGRAAEAAAPLRESLELDPGQPRVRRQLRTVLEGLGDWEGVIECLAQEARQLAPEARVTVYDEAARLASEHLGPDASLDWLERLRAARPDDPETLARIADVHRRSERPAELVRTLEAQLALEPEADGIRDLHLERAALYEGALALPGMAAEALEAAREADPNAPGVLERLTRLYARADRPEELARTIQARLGGARDRERRALYQDLAALQAGTLGDPARAARSLWSALGDGAASPAERIELLRSLGDAFQRGGRADLWGRAAEAELASLDPSQPVFAERRWELHRELARAYGGALARPGPALAHWRALLDDAGEEGLGRSYDEAEAALLDGLRAAGEHVELARRLEQHLVREPEDAARWLELARLRAERLHRPGGAAAAYRQVLELDGGCPEAMQGLRTVAERIGDWAEVARILEAEIELPLERPPAARAALWRRLGEIAWRRLDSTTRASRAFAAALEADPGDLVSLRSLQALCEAVEDWRGALDFFESEVEVLGDAEPERRQEIWLRVAELTRDRLEDLERSARAFDAAAELGALSLARRAEWADLYRRLDERERFAAVFAPWCDAEGSPATAEDHLELARVLEDLGRMQPARERVERAVEIEAKHAEAWDELVRLREATGDLVGCGEALERAADCRAGDAAAERRHRAARLVEGEDAERALELLERAVTDDPSRTAAHADLARVAEALGRPGRALVAAERMLELGAPGDEPERTLDAALAGARAARALEQPRAAEPLYAAARAVEPGCPEAVAGHAEILFERGEHGAARGALEELLGLETEDPERALHLAQLAVCLDADGDADAALATFEEAIEKDACLALAQEGRIALLEGADRIPDAVSALRAWADGAGEPPERAGRLVRAAAHELAGGRETEAEALLRQATEIDATHERAWALLARTLAEAGRSDEALDVATRALDALPDSAEARAGLCRVRGEALEQAGERAAAAEAYLAAARLDPTASEAALAGARLLRGLGEWREAADALREFVNAHRGTDSAGLAAVLHQLGRLLAGPLESVEGAIEVYRRAVAADPELPGLREALADLMAHRPEHAEEALRHQLDLLDADPLRQPSLRAVLRIAQARGNSEAVTRGRRILTALGIASSEEREGDPETVTLSGLGAPRFADPIWEAARRLVQESARELGEALGTGEPGASEGAGAGDPLATFRNAVVTEEGRLAAPAVVPLPTGQLAEVVGLLADLAVEAEGVRGDGRLVNDLTRVLGRRSRKRLRRLLDGRGSDEIARIDFPRWREELRGLAGVAALASTGAPLRTALCAWLVAEHEGDEVPSPGPEDDVSALVAACPEARALLRRLVLDWIESVSDSSGRNA